VDPLEFRTRSGLVIEVPRRLLHEFKEIFMDECYISRLGLRIPERPIVIDIGANAGFFSLFAASRFPGARVFSYEPIARNFKQLKRNKDLNENVQIMLFPTAVYGYSGEISLSLDPSDGFTTSASVMGKPNAQDITIKVPCVALSDVFDEHHLEHCDLLKIDCEGSEYAILYNCQAEYLRRISQIVIEVHQGKAPNQTIKSLTLYLNQNGFKTRRYSEHMLCAWRRR
jgi:FkbM family methyltransferase